MTGRSLNGLRPVFLCSPQAAETLSLAPIVNAALAVGVSYDTVPDFDLGKQTAERRLNVFKETCDPSRRDAIGELLKIL
ncbi:MAG: hypothetical protein V3W41_06865 [Planctomycetota bacterium]